MAEGRLVPEGLQIPTEECIGGGPHDFMEPVVVRSRSWLLVFFDSSEASIVFCNRCGLAKAGGYGVDGEL